MESQPMTVSVTQPVGQAIERVKRVLFQPFDLGKWITIGFCAWLAQLGEGGGGGSGHGNFGPNHGRGVEGIREGVERARDYVMNNLSWIVPLAAAALLVLLALWVLVVWLSSRGRFMFLHCVALNKGEVAVPWRKYAREANSLFWFRLLVGVSGLAVILPLLAVMALAGWRMIERGKASVGGIVELAGGGLLLVLIGTVFWLIHRLTADFVVPIMFRRGIKCLQGWGVVLGLLAGNLGRFVLYLLFWIVLSVGIGIVVVMAVLVTCCIACCVLAIPFVGTVLLLPVLVFQRAYSLYYLAQYGGEYDVFSAAPGPTA